MPKNDNTLHILSIDFDFFQITDLTTLTTCYPDGIDLPSELSKIVWASHYATPYTRKRLDTVKCDEKQLNDLIRILHDQTQTNIPTMICNSHVHIYDFIKMHFDPNKYNKLDIVNIDMHHDCFNKNKALDCGNWVSHVRKYIKNTNLTWIAQPVGLAAYDLDKDFSSHIKTNINTIKNKEFNLIFLCRSDNWLPPHLDPYFALLTNELQTVTHDILVEEVVLKPRDITGLTEQMRIPQKFYKFYEKFNEYDHEVKKYEQQDK